MAIASPEFLRGYYHALEVLRASPWISDEAGRKFIRELLREAPDGGEAAIMSLNDAARRLGMNRRSLQRHIASGAIRPLRRQGRLCFTEAMLERFRSIPGRGRGRPKRPPVVIWTEPAEL